MAFRIVRNDITKMDTEAIVNTANEKVAVGTGCDHAIYMAAGYDKLLDYRRDHIGEVAEGEVFITPGFDLKAEYIIHAVSPVYVDGKSGEEEKLRACYQKSLELAYEKNIKSIAFPMISSGGFGYPKEEAMRIAVDEIHAFLFDHEMDVYLVVFGEKLTQMGKRVYPDLEAYIDEHYVEEKEAEEYSPKIYGVSSAGNAARVGRKFLSFDRKASLPEEGMAFDAAPAFDVSEDEYDDKIEALNEKISERMEHRLDTFAEYLMYLIKSKGMKNSEVYNRSVIVDRKVFSKIKNNPDYHPQKITALCLCVGAKLNIDEARDLLGRAGYAFSPSDKMDIIFSYFIENELYDMVEIDIQLEEHGLQSLIE